MFSDLENRAFLLGRRMADAAFSMDDNPFANLQPRLARKWVDGFVFENAFIRTAGRPANEEPRSHADAQDLRRTEEAACGVIVLDSRRVQA
jgi:hypothetical protein